MTTGLSCHCEETFKTDEIIQSPPEGRQEGILKGLRPLSAGLGARSAQRLPSSPLPYFYFMIFA